MILCMKIVVLEHVYMYITQMWYKMMYIHDTLTVILFISISLTVKIHISPQPCCWQVCSWLHYEFDQSLRRFVWLVQMMLEIVASWLCFYNSVEVFTIGVSMSGWAETIGMEWAWRLAGGGDGIIMYITAQKPEIHNLNLSSHNLQCDELLTYTFNKYLTKVFGDKIYN